MSKKGKRKNKNNYLNLDNMYDMVLFFDNYVKDCNRDEVERRAAKDKTSETPNFIEEDGELYVDKHGAKIILSWINTDFSNYEDTIDFLIDNAIEEEKSELDIEVKIDIKNNTGYPKKELKRYIENRILGISTLGKQLDEIDVNLLHEKDIETINNSKQEFQKVLDEADDYIPNDECIKAAYNYVDKNDPEILRRMRYKYDYDPISVADHMERYNHMNFKTLKNNTKKDLNKGRYPSSNNRQQTHKRKKNKKRRK